MKKLSEFVNESSEDIDEQWINDDKPVQTKDGRQAIIKRIDMTKVPNVLIGTVKIGDKLVDYEWDEYGKCLKATDQYGAGKRPDDSDRLIKA